MRRRRAMQEWHRAAAPRLERVVRAEEALVEASEGPAVVVHARCDQLAAAVAEFQRWLQAHRCPDGVYATYVGELQSASLGLCAILQLVVREQPDGRWIGDHDLVDRVGTNLLDRIEQADRARAYLRTWAVRNVRNV